MSQTFAIVLEEKGKDRLYYDGSCFNSQRVQARRYQNRREVYEAIGRFVVGYLADICVIRLKQKGEK